MATQKSLSPVARSAVLMIRTYQVLLSPLLGQHCRFYPSCSQYTLEAIKEWGLTKGVWLGTKRICRCHPLNEGGIDPVPRRNPLPESTSDTALSCSSESTHTQNCASINPSQNSSEPLAGSTNSESTSK